ncbi:Pex12 amino terminal region-domain-containing protein [Schizophyllum fasciatum]
MAGRTAWEDAWERALPRLSSIRETLSTNALVSRVTRVGKLDSELLDQELVQLLEEPLRKAFSLLNNNLRAQFQPELTLLIQLTLYKLSIWNQGASYGARLQDLRYHTPKSVNRQARAPSGLPKRLLLLHGAVTLLIPYLHGKLRTYALSKAWPDAPSSDRRRKLWELLTALESSYATFSLANFVAFLWNGRYRTIADRLCRMELTPSSRAGQRNVSYEFMNRQMVWHAFTEFLLFFLPLINARAVRRRLSSAMTTITDALTVSQRAGHTKRPRRGKYWSLPEGQCAICAENAAYNFNLADSSNALTSLTGASAPDAGEPPQFPVNVPYAASCRDVYCYHCLAERLMRVTDEGGAAQGWECLRCGESVRAGERWMAPIEDVSSGDSLSEYDFTSDMEATDLSGSLVSGTYSDDPSSPEHDR